MNTNKKYIKKMFIASVAVTASIAGVSPVASLQVLSPIVAYAETIDSTSISNIIDPSSQVKVTLGDYGDITKYDNCLWMGNSYKYFGYAHFKVPADGKPKIMKITAEANESNHAQFWIYGIDENYSTNNQTYKLLAEEYSPASGDQTYEDIQIPGNITQITIRVKRGSDTNMGSSYFGNISVEYDNKSYTYVSGDTTAEYQNGTLTLTGSGSIDLSNVPDSVKKSASKVIIKNGFTDIPERCFENFISMESVSVGNGISKLGNYAFSRCLALKNIETPSSVQEIGSNCFEYCSNLSSIKLNDGIKTLGTTIFTGCTSLKNITIPKTVETMRYNHSSGYGWSNDYTVFEGSSIESVVFAEGMTAIPDNACYLASNIKSVTIPSTASSIGIDAFNKCDLSTVDLKNVSTIGNGAFKYNSNLVSVKSNDKITSIGELTFSGCSKLNSMASMKNIKTLGSSAFMNCTLLDNIQLPDTMESIGNNAFSATGITDIKVPKVTGEMGTGIFSNCQSLKNISFSADADKIGGEMFEFCTDLETVSIPGTIKSIYGSAFLNCSKLSSVELNEGIESLGLYIFNQCSQLKEITFPASIKTCAFNSYIVYGSSAEETVLYGSGIETVIFAEGTETIPNNACYGGRNSSEGYNSKIKKIVLPDTVKYINPNAFTNNKALTDVELPESLITISSSAFYGCSTLKDITFPSSLKTIESSAFQECLSLEEVEIPKSVTTIGNNVFSGCKGLKKVTINNATAYGMLNNAGSKEGIDVTISDGVKEISQETFGYAYIKSITIPNSVTSIGSAAFRGYNVNSEPVVIYTDNEKVINDYDWDNQGFQSAGQIFKSYDGSPYLTGAARCTVSETAFKGCGTNGIDIIFEDKVKAIPAGICNGVYKINSITIPNSVQRIGTNAFKPTEKSDVKIYSNISDIVNTYNWSGLNMSISIKDYESRPNK